MRDGLCLPIFDRAEVDRRCARALPRAPLAFGKGHLRLATARDGTVPLLAASVVADVEWGDARMQLSCAPELVSHLVTDLHGEVRTGTLEPELLGVLTEAAVLPAVQALEQRFRRPLHCLAIGTETVSGGASTLHLVVECGERRWPLLLRGNENVLRELLDAWPVAPLAWSHLPLRIACRIGVTRLTLAILRSLVPGDTVLFESQPIGVGMVVFGESRVASASAQDSAWRLDEAPHPAHGDEKEWVMQHGEEPLKEDEAGGLDDIPVRLAFDLGPVDMPLGEVRRLGAGTVIETGRRPDDFVRISANGRLVGHGRLVEVEGRVGVEIVRLFDHG